MKNFLLAAILLTTTSVLGRDFTIKVNNKYDTPITVEIRSGGKLGNTPLSPNMLASVTIAGKQTNASVKFKGDKKDIFSIVGRFNDGSSFLFNTFMIPSNDNESLSAIDLSPSTAQVIKSDSQYLLDMQKDFYNTADLTNPLKVNVPANDAFDKLLGSIVILEKDKSNKYTIEVDRIDAKVLKTNMQPRFVTDRSRNFEYVLSNSFLTNNKANIPAAADISFNFTNNNHYKFNYTALGFGKILHSDPRGKSVEARFDSLDSSQKRSFLLNLAQDSTNRYKVFVCNEAYVFKAMYLRIEEYEQSNVSNNINATTFFKNDGAISRSNTKAFEDIFGPTVLAIGFNASEKTAYFKRLAKAEVTSLQRNVAAGKIPASAIQTLINKALSQRQDSNSEPGLPTEVKITSKEEAERVLEKLKTNASM